MRIGVVQTNPAFAKVDANLRRVGELLASSRADLWVLPEFCASGYQFTSLEEVTALAEPVPGGRTTVWLAEFARATGAYLVAGLPEWDGNRLRNTAILVGPAGLVARYRKVHLFGEEKRWFSSGEEPFPVSDIGLCRVGMMVCFDHLFPEAARTLALAGADLLAHPANLVLPGVGQLTMRVRALENRVFAATANRVGIEARAGEPLHFTGESQIVSPRGDVLSCLPKEGEGVLVEEIDPCAARQKAINRWNDLFADRRPDCYRLSP